MAKVFSKLLHKLRREATQTLNNFRRLGAELHARCASDCPGLIDVAKKVVFLEERQPALDQMVEGNRLLNAQSAPITLTHIRPARLTL